MEALHSNDCSFSSGLQGVEYPPTVIMSCGDHWHWEGGPGYVSLAVQKFTPVEQKNCYVNLLDEIQSSGTLWIWSINEPIAHRPDWTNYYSQWSRLLLQGLLGFWHYLILAEFSFPFLIFYILCVKSWPFCQDLAFKFVTTVFRLRRKLFKCLIHQPAKIQQVIFRC